MNHPILLSLFGNLFAFAGTAAGAAMIYCIRGELKEGLHQAFLGFASGVMIAASVWSLLLPAMELSGEGVKALLPPCIGFAAGGLFLFCLDRILPHLHADSQKPEGPKSSLRRSTMLVLAVTLHNIPEGMAVGLSFALAANPESGQSLASAGALALGMALQNFPEGAAISLPLKKEGLSTHRAFLYGAASGVVEPIAGIVGALLAMFISPIMPYLLSFAAGAMIYVVIEELVPEAYHEHSHGGTIAALVGFELMMALDIILS